MRRNSLLDLVEAWVELQIVSRLLTIVLVPILLVIGLYSSKALGIVMLAMLVFAGAVFLYWGVRILFAFLTGGL